MNQIRNSLHPTLTVKHSGKKFRLSVERAFSLAHQLANLGHLESAIAILEWLEQILPNDRRIKVLHARCAARRGNYAECSQHLNQVFPVEDRFEGVQGTLHAAIVYRATNLLADARQELKELCEHYPELPSLWLFSGDLWMAVGRPDRAVNAWQMAIDRDAAAPKLIATAGRHRIRELTVESGGRRYDSTNSQGRRA